MSKTSFVEQVQAIRAARDARMKTSPQSWLALIGLFRLEAGENPFGAFAANKIVLAKCGEAQCGSFHLENGTVRLLPQLNTNLKVNDLPPESRDLKTDRDEQTDLIRAGSLTMMVLQRGNDHYLRVWDGESPAVDNFTGLRYYPIKPAYRIVVKFVPYDPPKTIQIQDVIGGEHDGFLAGEAHFNLHGTECYLVAEDAGDELLFSFTDETRNDTTYPGGRYLTTEEPQNDQMILDFNLAVNWPCAYTAYATCPLPPAENHLSVRIEAGEMRYQEH
jgi:uncharacterized protein (DUF1684 family)